MDSCVHEQGCGWGGLAEGVGGPWQMQSSHPSMGSASRASPESSTSATGRSEGIFSALYDLSGEDQVVGTGIPFSSSL